MIQKQWSNAHQSVKIGIMNFFKKNEVTLLKYSNIKLGDLVVFIDGSWTMCIGNDDFEMKHDFLGLNEDIWQVICINTPVPTENILDVCCTQNNMIVKNHKGDIAFCSQINVKTIDPHFFVQ